MRPGQMVVLGLVLLVWLAIRTGFAKWLILAMVLESIFG